MAKIIRFILAVMRVLGIGAEADHEPKENAVSMDRPRRPRSKRATKVMAEMAAALDRVTVKIPDFTAVCVHGAVVWTNIPEGQIVMTFNTPKLEIDGGITPSTPVFDHPPNPKNGMTVLFGEPELGVVATVTFAKSRDGIPFSYDVSRYGTSLLQTADVDACVTKAVDVMVEAKKDFPKERSDAAWRAYERAMNSLADRLVDTWLAEETVK